MKINRILFPTDFSPQNIKVKEYILSLGRLLRCDIHILHAVEPINGGEHDGEIQKFYQELLNQSNKRMQDEVAYFKNQGLNVESHVEVAPRWQAINRYAESKRMDLVIMGSSRTLTPHGAFSVGSTSHKVFATATCPVLFVF